MIISILIPVYNTKQYLAECVESVLRQTNCDFEIILCDDASTDGSGQLCDEYARMYPDVIRAVHNAKNQGSLLTRRKLFAQAKGDWILCVDSDDTLEHQALEKMKHVIDGSAPDMVVFDLTCLHIDGKREIFSPSLEKNKMYESGGKSDVYNAVFENQSLNSLCTKAFKREIVDVQVDYSSFSELKIGEDRFQSLPLFDSATKIYYLPESLYCYRKNEGGVTSKFDQAFYSMRKILWNREDCYIRKWNVAQSQIEKTMMKRINEIILFLKDAFGHCTEDDFNRFFHSIREDGLYKNFINLLVHQKVRNRYSLYIKLLDKKHINLFKLCMRFEWGITALRRGLVK